MRIKLTHWIFFILLSAIALCAWYFLTYPHFSFINLSVDRLKARSTARNFLEKHCNVDADDYTSATVFSGRRMSDRYLQKSLGFKKELEFFQEHDFELFFWKTRFFQENNPEQFFITVSAATGEVTSFSRHIKSTASRKDYGREDARRKGINFLTEHFNFNEDDYEILTNLARIRDNRTDYTFEWGRKEIFIPWNDTPDESGAARLLTGITISGNEVLSFTKQKLKIPDEFKRYFKRIQNTGKNLGIVFRFTFFAFLAAAVFYVIVKRNSILLHAVKTPGLVITAALFLSEVGLYLNGLEYVIFEYPTTSSFLSYFWRFFSNQILNTFMVTLVFLMPFLAGEVLHYEVFPKKRKNTLFHHIRSTFFSRNVGGLILLGYCCAVILLGLQALLFHIGEAHFGVWTEYLWMTSFTSSYIPAVPVFVIAFSASLTEETMFRVFGISLGKTFLKNTAAAAIISSVIWGFGHTGYPIYPMWFRGLETTCLGIILSLVYLKFGLIPVLTAHYLFNAFWASANFILGTSAPRMFYSSLCVLILPLIFALAAFLMNRKETSAPVIWNLSPAQRFNLMILKYYLKDHPFPEGKNREECLRDITAKGWDIAVVETAFQELKLTK